MDKMIVKNEPETMKQIGEQTSKLAYLNEKLADLHSGKVKSEEQKRKQESTLEEMRMKMAKLEQMAGQYGINLETHEED